MGTNIHGALPVSGACCKCPGGCGFEPPPQPHKGNTAAVPHLQSEELGQFLLVLEQAALQQMALHHHPILNSYHKVFPGKTDLKCY